MKNLLTILLLLTIGTATATAHVGATHTITIVNGLVKSSTLLPI